MTPNNGDEYTGVLNPTTKNTGPTIIANREKCYQKPLCWSCTSYICLIIVLSVLSYGVYEIYEYFVNTIREREEIDNRQVFWKESHSIDYETGLIQNCSTVEPCKFNCHYLRENLKEEKKVCEYDDLMDIWKWVLIVWGILVLCGCLCNSSKHRGGE